MTISARTIILAGTLAVSALILFTAILHAQEVSDVQDPGLQESPASDSSGNSGTPLRDRIANTISGIKSGDISTAKEAAEFDNLLSRTLIRISDCWTLCKQEMVLSKEYARQEAVQAAKDIFQKGKDAAVEQTRETILENLPVLNPAKMMNDDNTVVPTPPDKEETESKSESVESEDVFSTFNGNDPKAIREMVQERLSTPVSAENDLTKKREAIQEQLKKPATPNSDFTRMRMSIQERLRGN